MERSGGGAAVVALVRDFGRRFPPGSVGVAALGRILALAVGLAAIAGAVLFADQSVLHFWHEIRAVYRNRGVNSRLDFTWFFYGMQTAWLHADPVHNLYSIPAQDRWMQQNHFPYDHADVFGYPPPFALLWSPLASLPYLAARQLWTQINIGALGVGLAVAAWHASPRFGLARWLLLASMGLWAVALNSNFYWGQPNAVTLALVALGVAGVIRGGGAPGGVSAPRTSSISSSPPAPPRPAVWPPVLGGVALGLAAVLKLTPAVIIAYLTVRWVISRGNERGRSAGIGALAGWATVAVACAAAGMVLGWPTLSIYVHQTIPAVERSAWMHGAAPWNQSFRGLLMNWHHTDRWLTHASDLFAVGVFALAVAAAALRPSLDFRLEAALAALLVLLCSPSLEDHHFTVAILPGILLAGYLLDRLSHWRKWWLLPVVIPFIGASVALVAPGRLHWPPVLLGGQVVVPVAPGQYNRVYMLGAASYGPVRFSLGLRYRGTAGTVPADWPDWWSPGNPLHPVLSGVAESAGKVSNGNVGLYGFGYPVQVGQTLTGLGLPAKLPQQNGGPEALHVVAVTLERAGGGFVEVPLAYNAHGIASSARMRVPSPMSFDGNGNLFWMGGWRQGVQHFTVDGTSVPFSLPGAGSADNILNVPPAAASPAPGGPRWLQVLLGKAPSFVGIALLFITAWAAGVVEPPQPEEAGAGGH